MDEKVIWKPIVFKLILKDHNYKVKGYVKWGIPHTLLMYVTEKAESHTGQRAKK